VSAVAGRYTLRSALRKVGQQQEWDVRVDISPHHEFLETFGFLSGLSTLAAAGEIKLRAVRQPNSDAAPGVLRLSVRHLRSGDTRSAALELFDRGDLFDVRTLEAVDTYFKNTFQAESLNALPRCLADKVKPGGLTFACYLPGTRGYLARIALVSFRTHWEAFGLRALKRAFNRFRHDLAELEGILGTTVWERQEDEMPEQRVVFQTRIWPPERDPKIDRDGVNRERMELVSTLRAEFGSGDYIGLLHTRFAEETAPDLLTSRKVSKREYAKQLRTSLVAVNSHGLDGSAGFKIAESLAAGAALVTQRFRFDLPEPLVEGINYLAYETPSECVDQCRRLLEDRSLAEQMRTANRDYYRHYVRPDALARNLLRRLVQDGPE
jgi:hypothetical protein